MALKTYTQAFEEDFIAEQEALESLSKNKRGRSIVRYLGHFTQETLVDGKIEKTYNLLMEFGDNDLDEYFATSQPPATTEDTIAFWRNLSRIAQALSLIHDFKHSPQGDYYG